MKKLHYLSAFLLLAAGATSSYAQKWVVNDGDEYLTSIPVGVPVALHSVTGNAYLCGTGNGVSNKIRDFCQLFVNALCTGAGMGLMVLFRQNKNTKDTVRLLLWLYGSGVLAGLLLQFVFA